MTTWFTSDLHLSHERICELAGRPFTSVDEMNAALVERWNDRVSEGDTVWVLGDVCMGKITDSLAVAVTLRGHKILVPGNHDRVSSLYHGSSAAKKAEWRAAYEAAGFVIADELLRGMAFGTLDIFDLCHFPYTDDSHGEDRYAEARPADEGRWLLHGHTHQAERISGERQLHVGVDAWDFAPVALETLVELIA